MRLSELTYLFIDVQTTGGSPRCGRLLELGWCLGPSEQAALASRGERLIGPREPIPRAVSRVTGITEAMLDGAGTPAAALAALVAAVGTQAQVVLIHAARFERSFLEPLWRSERQEEFPWPVICTYALAQRLVPQLPSLSLHAVAGRFGHLLPRERRAGDHAVATAAIWRGLHGLLDAAGVHELGQLQNWLAKPKAKAAVKVRKEYAVERSFRLALPESSGIYRMCDQAGRVLYVGKAQSLKSRVNSYFRQTRGHGAGKREMLAQVSQVEITQTETAIEAALLETDEIKRLEPPYNTALRQGQRQACYVDADLQPVLGGAGRGKLYGPFGRQEPMLLPGLVARSLHGELRLEELCTGLYAAVQPLVVQEGLTLFRLAHGLNTSVVHTPRQLLALGVRAYRQRLLEKAPADDLQDVEQDDEPAADPADPAEGSEGLTAEQLAGALTEGLVAAGRAFVQARALRRLQCSDVSWREEPQGPWRRLAVRAGAIVARAWSEEPEEASEPSLGAQLPDDIASYDRMRVLLTELNRTRKSGRSVQVHYRLEP